MIPEKDGKSNAARPARQEPAAQRKKARLRLMQPGLCRTILQKQK